MLFTIYFLIFNHIIAKLDHLIILYRVIGLIQYEIV